MKTQIINGTEGGRHVTGGPLTTAVTETAVPGLLRNAIDQRIVKIRPSSTPIDQLSRCGAARQCGAMTVEYYTVDSLPAEAKTTQDLDSDDLTTKPDGMVTYFIHTTNDMIFNQTETILVPDIKVGDQPLMLYVFNRNESGVEVAAVNPTMTKNELIELPKGSRLVRMGRAATELDVMTPQYQALPVKTSNNCQIFKMQVEESTFNKIANKEVNWNFTDQEEAAVSDMRRGMEKNFLFGARNTLYDPYKGEYVHFTGGIWGQAGSEVSVKISGMTEDDLISLCAKAFTGNNSSKRKILIGGTGLIEALSHIPYTKTISAGQTFTKWGIKFNEIQSNFGSLFVVHSEIFDQCGHSNDGMVLDPEYMTKYVHVPFRTDRIDLSRNGTRNTSAVVITEASCIVLRFPKAHFRIVGSNA